VSTENPLALYAKKSNLALKSSKFSRKQINPFMHCGHRQNTLDNPIQLRNRMVNFRVTDDEYRQLLTETRARGSRSVSDYARSTVLRQNAALSLVEQPETPRDKWLDEQLTRLESSIHRVLELLNNSTSGQWPRTDNGGNLPLSKG
jgi:hypothetical protein